MLVFLWLEEGPFTCPIYLASKRLLDLSNMTYRLTGAGIVSSVPRAKQCLQQLALSYGRDDLSCSYKRQQEQGDRWIEIYKLKL